MNRVCRTAAAVAAVIMSAAIANAQTGPVIEKKDPALDALISPDAKLEKIADGFAFTEGAVWVPKGKGYLLFSEMPGNVIYKWTPDGKVSVFRDKCGYQGVDVWRVGFLQTNGKEKSDPAYEEFPMIGCNGLALDPQGRLVIATWAGRGIDRIERNGKRVTLADSFDGKKLNGTNDLVVRKDGTIYFTDGVGGLRKRDEDPRRGVDFRGIYMLRNGKVTRAITDIQNPNGLAFSPDQKILYANGGNQKFIRAYDVAPDGTLSNSRLLIDMSADKDRNITDGMKVDSKGNIWETGPRGVWIVSPQGKHLGTILVPELTANVAFGDRDYKTLYIPSRTSVYKIRTSVVGLP
jgi:gluconolactonase